jgi:CheY-like chemotaxis protein
MMPEVNGIEFARRLSALEGRADTPLLMVSATADRSIRSSALQQGVSGFMNKPLQFLELQARVAQMISMRSKQIETANTAVIIAKDLAADSSGSANTNQLLNAHGTLARLAGDETLLAHIASVFVRTVPQLLASIATALSTKCLDRAYADAHSLKGAVGAFDAPAVLSAVGILEQHAKVYNANAATAAFSLVETLCERLIEELTAMAGETAIQPPI